MNENLQAINMFISELDSRRLNQFDLILTLYKGTHRKDLEDLVAKRRSKLAGISPTLSMN